MEARRMIKTTMKKNNKRVTARNNDKAVNPINC